MPTPTYVDLSTNLGEIILQLRPDAAPNTVANFLSYATNATYGQGYTGSFLHRLVTGFVATPATTPSTGEAGTTPHRRRRQRQLRGG